MLAALHESPLGQIAAQLIVRPKSTLLMDPAKEQIFRTYAWAYFSFHADQRMKTFNFFLVVAGLLAGGVVTLMRDSGNPWIIAPLGLALSILCFLFWRLDQRNRVLVRNGEAAVKFLDSQHVLPTSDGAPHVLHIFEHDDFKRKGQSRSPFREAYFSYSKVISYVYALFAFLGIFLAIAPFFVTKQYFTPSAVQPQTPLLPAAPTPDMLPSATQKPTQATPAPTLQPTPQLAPARAVPIPTKPQ